jgi:hypothetical protein
MTDGDARAPGAAYWLRVTAVTGAVASVLTVLLATPGGAPLVATLRNVLVHSTLMAGLCSTLTPWIRHRLRTADPLVQWAVTVPPLLGRSV